MSRVDGSLARKLDFGEMTTTTATAMISGRTGLHLADRGGRLLGPDKYKVLERRRRRAQIDARRQLGLLD